MKFRKKLTNLLLALCVTVSTVGINEIKVHAANYWPEGPETTSPCVIVMEEETGTVLYEKMADEQHYPASITKIMTALLAIENCSMDEVVTFSQDAVYNTDGSSIWRDIGEKMTMEECLYALMLNSSNDCAYAIAEHVGGTLGHFVDMMNDKAKELGCQNTHFANPHGLPDDNHYTCCRDMALIAREAYKNENFRIITGSASYTIPPTNKHDENTYLRNHNEMLAPYKLGTYVYPYCTGGKTGWTPEANSTLVTYASKDGMTLVCVVMNTIAPAQWEDSTSLYNFCFDNFQVLNVADNERRFDGEVKNAGTLNVNTDYVRLDDNGVIVLPKTAEFSEAEPQVTDDSTDDNVVGRISYTFADRNVGGADIVKTNAEIDKFQFDNEKEETETESLTRTKKKVVKLDFKKILLGIVIAAAAVGLFFVIRYFVDNFYIIRHKFTSRSSGKLFQGKKYRTIKDSRKYRRRRRFGRRR